MRDLFENPGFLTLLIIVMLVAGLAFIGSTQGFSARCAKVYERNTAAHELCVARTSQGGPVFEENIGKI